MKRLHVHVSVADLGSAVTFYSTLFDARPGVHKADYARWVLDDPRVNFAISLSDRAPGVSHLGIQAQDSAELAVLSDRVDRVGGAVLDEGEVSCCYARSEKSWVQDPAGVAWEMFETRGHADRLGSETTGPAGLVGQAPGTANCCA